MFWVITLVHTNGGHSSATGKTKEEAQLKAQEFANRHNNYLVCSLPYQAKLRSFLFLYLPTLAPFDCSVPIEVKEDWQKFEIWKIYQKE